MIEETFSAYNMPLHVRRQVAQFTSAQVAVFRRVIRERPWQSTPTAFQAELRRIATSFDEPPFWPSELRTFGRWLREIVVDLADQGIGLEFDHGRDRQKTRLVRVVPQPVQESLPVEVDVPEPPPIPVEPPLPSQRALMALTMARNHEFTDVWTDGHTVFARGIASSHPQLEGLLPHVEELVPALPDKPPPRRRPRMNWCFWRFGRDDRGVMSLIGVPPGTFGGA